MQNSARISLVNTLPERCRVCYTCVRECPAKAIRITGGQAEVIHERCIGCGNCVQVCSQGAKAARDGIAEVMSLLDSGARVAACVAPSFPAEFTGLAPEEFAGQLRALGFALVTEVAFGADLVAAQYKRLTQADTDGHYIATTCPAVVAYVERYFPELVPRLAPVVSPMVAMARALRQLHGSETKIVFLGPCIAKKGEAVSESVAGEIDGVLTFAELRRLFAARHIERRSPSPTPFDPPHPGAGALFPVCHGLLQAAGIPEDLAAGDVVVAHGRRGFVDAVKALNAGHCTPRLLEVLACEGCIMGPGMSTNLPLFTRRDAVSRYVRKNAAPEKATPLESFANLDLTRVFACDDRRLPDPSGSELASILDRMGKRSPQDELNCGACGYETCREHATAIFRGLAESEMCLPYTIDRLRDTVETLEISKDKLAKTQEILMHSEKLASMGQLAAGIAHEINNPLGVVLMYAHMLMEEHAGEEPLREDLQMITTQADRCKKIVAGLLHFARKHKVSLQETNVCRFVEQCAALAAKPLGIRLSIEHLIEDPMADLDQDQMSQVITNLLTNAFQAMPYGGRVQIRTEGDTDEVRFIVADSGPGIAKTELSKIFEPFYTTKDVGKGTGLGLALSYGIVKMHRGDIRVESNADPSAGPTGTTFTLSLPRYGRLGAEDEEAAHA